MQTNRKLAKGEIGLGTTSREPERGEIGPGAPSHRLREELTKAKRRQENIDKDLRDGAIEAATHTVGILKSCISDLDLSLLPRGYHKSVDVDGLLEEIRPNVADLVNKLDLSLHESDED